MTLKCRPNPPRKAFSRLAAVRLLTVSLLAGLLTAGLTSCGSEEAQLLPGETAREIIANLDTVKQLAAEGDCTGAESAALQVGEQVEAIGGVDARLKQALRQGAERLNEVVATCVPEVTEETIEEAVPAPPTSPAAKPKKEKPKDKKGKEEAAIAPAPPEEAPPALPPQANGEAKGHEEPSVPDESAEGPSGGISPSSSVEGGEG
jgi:hypothetical protein